MSFNTDGGGSLSSEPARCAEPDYEAEAKNLNDRLKTISELDSALHEFIESDSEVYRFNKITSLAELLGGVSILKAEVSTRYTGVLKVIEAKE